MLRVINVIVVAILTLFRTRRNLVLENLALRQQLAVLNRTVKVRRLHQSDRLFWAILSRGWRHALVIVQPDTVVRWHRAAFKAFWTRRSKKRKPGRPLLAVETRVADPEDE